VGGDALYFKVAGVWRRNMIMIDTQTNSLWQQATGLCIYGRYKGQHLTMLPAENTIWQSWQKKYPDSEVANGFIEARRGLLSRQHMFTALKAVTSRVSVPGMTDLSGLPKRETVFGLVVNGQSKAYPQTRLTPGETFTDHIGGEKIQLTYDQAADYLLAEYAGSSDLLSVEKHWWLGWKEFHPDTAIWQIKDVDCKR
jgi:hypothetical protein